MNGAYLRSITQRSALNFRQCVMNLLVIRNFSFWERERNEKDFNLFLKISYIRCCFCDGTLSAIETVRRIWKENNRKIFIKSLHYSVKIKKIKISGNLEVCILKNHHPELCSVTLRAVAIAVFIYIVFI